MARTAAFLWVLLVAAGASWAIINPNFTPRHLVDQSEIVATAMVSAGGNSSEWKLAPAEQIKGKLDAAQVLDLSKCNADQVKDVQEKLSASGKEPAVVFIGTKDQVKEIFLHVSGAWLAGKLAGGDRWEIAGFAAQMSGTFAGGTDMLGA